MWVKRTDLGSQPGGQHAIDGVTFQETEARVTPIYHRGHDAACRPSGEIDHVIDAPCRSGGRRVHVAVILSAGHRTWDGETATGKLVPAGELTVYPAPPVSA